jgi:ADP-heptose:LPS heptosyltransferase
MHAVDRSLALVESLGARFEGMPISRHCVSENGAADCGYAPAAIEMFPLAIGAEERGAVDAWLAARRVDPTRNPLVILNPHCRKDANIWPAARFSELAQRLLADGVDVALTGGPIAKPWCDEIAAPLADRVLRADGAFSLLGSAELIRRAALFVTGDTGPMHIAAAVGTPIVALFGPADPLRTGPYASDAVVLTKRLACAPCFATHCPLGHKPAKCMTDITVDETYEAVTRRLRETAAPNVDKARRDAA